MAKKKPSVNKNPAEKATSSITTKPSAPAVVDAFLLQLKHPMIDVVKGLRKVILSADKEIGEEIKWNAPTFFYTGKMKPSDPKKYERYLVVFNFSKKDSIRLVFPSGAPLNDTSGLLEGDYTDGRRLAAFQSMADVKKWEKTMLALIKKWVKSLEK